MGHSDRIAGLKMEATANTTGHALPTFPRADADATVNISNTTMSTSASTGKKRKLPLGSTPVDEIKPSKIKTSTTMAAACGGSDKKVKRSPMVKELKRKLKAAERMAQTSRHLFQFACKLQRSQYISAEVRARELEERHAALVARREALERKIRRVKRETHHYEEELCAPEPPVHAVSERRELRHDTSVAGSMSTSFQQTRSSGVIVMQRDVSTTTTFSSRASVERVDGLAPSSTIENLEAKIEQTMRLRWKNMNEMLKDMHGIGGLSEQIARLR